MRLQVVDLVRAVQEVEAANPTQPLDWALQTTAAMLGIVPYTESEYRSLLLQVVRTPRRRPRGRPAADAMTRGEAVAAVAVYFESIGARPEQALREAQRWLGVRVSRKVGKAAIKAFRAMCLPSEKQHYLHAAIALTNFVSPTAPKLPTQLTPTTRRRRPRMSSRLYVPSSWS